MMTAEKKPAYNPLSEYIQRLQTGETLLKDTPDNVLEVVGILKSYGVVLDAYSKNLIYIAEHQFLIFFPFFKYFNAEVLNVKKSLIKIAQNMLNFGRRIKIF